MFCAALKPACLLPHLLSYTQEGVEPFGADCWEIARVLAGRPKAGAELTEDYNPLEAGLYHACSVTKGCSIGQETINKVRQGFAFVESGGGRVVGCAGPSTVHSSGCCCMPSPAGCYIPPYTPQQQLLGLELDIIKQTTEAHSPPSHPQHRTGAQPERRQAAAVGAGDGGPLRCGRCSSGARWHEAGQSHELHRHALRCASAGLGVLCCECCMQGAAAACVGKVTSYIDTLSGAQRYWLVWFCVPTGF